MRTILDESQELPDGLWLVKWIDCVSRGRDSLGLLRIQLVLQKLKQGDIAAINRLSTSETSLLIGRRPDQPSSDVPMWAQPRGVLLGALPLIKIGDIVRGRRIEGALRQRELNLSIDTKSEVRALGIFDEYAAPKDWRGTYRALNRFEYELGVSPEVSGSRCVIIKNSNVEYVIPDTVILRTFYAFHSKLANAIYSGPWDQSYSQVISTLNYASGIGTYVNNQTGAWNIVVQSGLNHDHAIRLAALYFDSYARRCTSAIHTSSTQQNHERRSDGDRRWFVRAKIPYRWDVQPLKIRVKALALRPHRFSEPELLRYLVTSIDATSWPFADQLIFTELANSNALSKDGNPKKVDEFYFGRKPKSVLADLDAELDHHSEAYKYAADNIVEADDFKFLNKPLHDIQRKSSHKEYLGSSKPPEEEASLRLSAGSTAPGSHKPAPLIAESRDRRLSPQLQLLLNTLDLLVDKNEIEGFEVIGPPEASYLLQLRNGLSCWSFPSEDQIRSIRSGRAASGWEFIFESPSIEGGARRAIPRCLLVVLIKLNGCNLMIFEVEPRASETAYRFYVIKVTETIELGFIESALITLRAFNGRLNEHGMTEAFRGLTKLRASAYNHSYIKNNDQDIIALNEASLLRALVRTCG